MKEIVFLDIDTQVDFMLPKGRLYVQDANTLIPALASLTHIAIENDILILSSVDTHSKNDPEFKQFPPHCLAGTRGAKKIPQTLCTRHSLIPQNVLSRRELYRTLKGRAQVMLQKNTYDIFVNLNLLPLLMPFKAAFVYGVALDYCVKYALLGLLQRGLEVYLITDATKAVDARQGRVLLEKCENNGVRLIKTKDIQKEIRRVAGE